MRPRTAALAAAMAWSARDARAQDPAAAPAAPAETTASDGPDGSEEPPKLSAEMGGAVLHASDDSETGRSRGAWLLAAGFRPIGMLEIEARYRMTAGSWSYLLSQPRFDGSAAFAETDELSHRIDLGARLDALFTLDLPLSIEPYLGVVYFGLESDLYRSRFFGGAGALGLRCELFERSAVEASGGLAGGASLADPDATRLGRVVGIWSWSSGAAFDPTDWSRVRLAYVGEAMAREHSTRVSHGAQLSFQAGFALPIERMASTRLHASTNPPGETR